MAKPKSGRRELNGRRVTRTDTGQTATYIETHEQGQHSVLLDTGPKAATVWPAGTPLEHSPRRPTNCGRCQERHHPFDCRSTP